MWLPIAGCTLDTSLQIVPRSHYLKENNVLRTSIKGAMINKNIYSVPCLLKTSQGKFKMIRPNPKYNEALIFTPFLIHGAAFNNSEQTRMALELRFARYSPL